MNPGGSCAAGADAREGGVEDLHLDEKDSSTPIGSDETYHVVGLTETTRFHLTLGRTSLRERWIVVAEPSSTSFTDTTVQAGRTYAYRVQASNTAGYCDSDLATIGAFTGATAAQPVTAAVAASTLAALNTIRAGAGLTALTWQTMLPSTEPPATAGNLITLRHLLALRSRVNEARQALGAPARAWTDPDPTGMVVEAIHWQELLLGAQ